jgi:hypothetical protein
MWRREGGVGEMGWHDFHGHSTWGGGGGVGAGETEGPWPIHPRPLAESSGELIKALHWGKWDGNGTARDSLKMKERGSDLILEEEHHGGEESL